MSGCSTRCRQDPDLCEALQQQTATGEVLKVIASSPTDVGRPSRPSSRAPARFAMPMMPVVLLKIGNDLHLQRPSWAHTDRSRATSDQQGWVVGRSVVDKVPVQVPNFLAPEAAEFPEGQRQSREQGHRCTLSVPLLREGEAIGAIALRRLEPIAFSDKQIALLQTFADQAVIAIENVRLFDEVQAKTRDLAEALTYQTGSANILSVIASSPTDVGPVLNAIVESACELCDAYDAVVFLKDGERPPLQRTSRPDTRSYLARMRRSTVTGSPDAPLLTRCRYMCTTAFSGDGDEFPEARELSRSAGHRTILSVPLLREDESIGAIVLRRTEVHPFTDKQIALAADLRRPGRDRDRQCPAVRGGAGSVRAS